MARRPSSTPRSAATSAGSWAASSSAARRPISFSTIADNGAPEASGFAAGGIGSESGTTVAMNGVVLSGNQLDLEQSNCGPGVAVTEGPDHNLESGDTCGLSTAGASLVNAAAELAPLADNGGPTPTRGLYPESPALDGGLAACTPAADQRGVARPGTSPRCDIGAFEGSVPRPPPATDLPFTTTPPGLPAVSGTPVCKTAAKGSGSLKKCGKKFKRAKNGKLREAQAQAREEAHRARRPRGRGDRARRDRPLGARPEDRRDPRRRPRRGAGRTGRRSDPRRRARRARCARPDLLGRARRRPALGDPEPQPRRVQRPASAATRAGWT